MSTTAEKVGRVCSGLFAALNATTFVACLLGLLRARTAFTATFKEMLEGAALPTLTNFFIGIPTPALVVLGCVLLVLLVAKEWIRPVWIPLVLNSFWLALGCVLVLVFAAAMMLPLISIITKLQ